MKFRKFWKFWEFRKFMVLSVSLLSPFFEKSDKAGKSKEYRNVLHF